MDELDDKARKTEVLLLKLDDIEWWNATIER